MVHFYLIKSNLCSLLTLSILAHALLAEKDVCKAITIAFQKATQESTKIFKDPNILWRISLF